jgi:hypothetical protein
LVVAAEYEHAALTEDMLDAVFWRARELLGGVRNRV